MAAASRATGWLVVTHLRGQDATRAESSKPAVRTPLADDLDIGSVTFAAPDRLLFTRLRTNLGVWTVPIGSGKVDLSKAALVEPDATSFVVSRRWHARVGDEPREKRELVWVTIDAGAGAESIGQSVANVPGKPFESTGSSVALSPDGRRVIVATRSADSKDEFVVRDLTTGADTRVPMPQASTGMQTGARTTWTPAGRLLYASGGVETLQIYDWPADGSSNGRPLVAGMSAQMRRDGEEVLFIRDERQRLRLYRAPILADGTAGKAELVFAGADEPFVRWFDLSPDGTLLAFTRTDPTTGQLELFVDDVSGFARAPAGDVHRRDAAALFARRPSALFPVRHANGIHAAHPRRAERGDGHAETAWRHRAANAVRPQAARAAGRH